MAQWKYQTKFDFSKDRANINITRDNRPKACDAISASLESKVIPTYQRTRNMSHISAVSQTMKFKTPRVRFFQDLKMNELEPAGSWSPQAPRDGTFCDNTDHNCKVQANIPLCATFSLLWKWERKDHSFWSKRMNFVRKSRQFSWNCFPKDICRRMMILGNHLGCLSFSEVLMFLFSFNGPSAEFSNDSIIWRKKFLSCCFCKRRQCQPSPLCFLDSVGMADASTPITHQKTLQVGHVPITRLHNTSACNGCWSSSKVPWFCNDFAMTKTQKAKVST